MARPRLEKLEVLCPCGGVVLVWSKWDREDAPGVVVRNCPACGAVLAADPNELRACIRVERGPRPFRIPTIAAPPPLDTRFVMKKKRGRP